MTRKLAENEPVRRAIREMAVGDTLAIPAERSANVRSVVSDISWPEGRKYSTRRDKEARVVNVTRYE